MGVYVSEITMPKGDGSKLVLQIFPNGEVYDGHGIRLGITNWAEAVPAADVRPVVTCGKCKYGKYTGVSWFCDKHSGHADKFGEDASYHEYHSKYWFCADGEEKNHA